MNPQEHQAIVAECSTLALAFALHVDMGHYERVAALFAVDASFERRGSTLQGRAEILASMKARSPFMRTRHLCSPPYIDVIDADHASGITYFAVYRHEGKAALAGPAPMPQGAESIGEFYDSFVRTPEGWRIASRKAQGSFSRLVQAAS